MRHSQPPALIALRLQQLNALVPCAMPCDGCPDQCPSSASSAVGLAERRVIACCGRRLDGAVRIARRRGADRRDGCTCERARTRTRRRARHRRAETALASCGSSTSTLSRKRPRKYSECAWRRATSSIRRSRSRPSGSRCRRRAARSRCRIASAFAYTRAARSAARTSHVTDSIDQIRARIVIGERRGQIVETIAVQFLERLRRFAGGARGGGATAGCRRRRPASARA